MWPIGSVVALVEDSTTFHEVDQSARGLNV
jgi:hypothetical protein